MRVITSRPTEPWRELTPEVADAIEPVLPEITREIIEAVAREVPEYARPLEGSFGRGLRVGVDEALSQFVALIRDPDAGRRGRDVYVGLGRGELRQGRTLDSLQSAYRVGARVAWRRIAAAGRRAGLEPEVLNLLAEAIFAYIDELSADSVEGYAAEQSEREGERLRRRRELAVMLLRDPPADPADVRGAAQAASFELPRSIAAMACPEADLDPIARRLPDDAIAARIDGLGCVMVADPEAPGREDEIGRAADATSSPTAIGPAVEAVHALHSWRLAKLGLRAAEAGALPAAGPIRTERHLADLLVFENPLLTGMIAEQRLGPLEELTPKARERMRETTLSYLRHRGNAAEMARAMHVHPQTARYRLARLRELLGEQLDDPDARFELELALRARPGSENA